jgi:hypothetical protein
MTTEPETLPAEDCLEWDADMPSPCRGPVEYRESLTGTGTPIPRCDYHWNLRLDREDEHRRIYPDSPIAPAWFDPEAAGERWDDDY